MMGYLLGALRVRAELYKRALLSMEVYGYS